MENYLEPNEFFKPSIGNRTYIPLGTRCSSAFVVQNQLKVRTSSLPLDWVDLPIRNILQFVRLDMPEIDSFMEEYFNNIGVGLKHTDGSHFPHDEIYNNKEVELEKYTRRMRRLIELIKYSNIPITYLTVIADPLNGGVEDYNSLKLYLDKFGTNNQFITINLYDYDFILGNHTNYHIPLSTTLELATGDTFAEWEENIGHRIKKDFIIT